MVSLMRGGHVEGVLDALKGDFAAFGDAGGEGFAELTGVDFEAAVMLAQFFPHGLAGGLHEHIRAAHAPEELAERGDVAGKVSRLAELDFFERAEAWHVTPQPEGDARDEREDGHPAMVPEQ